MKKILKWIILIIVILILLFICFNKSTYTIKANKVDSYSPDIILEVYKDNKKIEYEEIQYLDGILLCEGNNKTVAYTDIIDEKDLIVILKNNKKVKAKIIED